VSAPHDLDDTWDTLPALSQSSQAEEYLQGRAIDASPIVEHDLARVLLQTQDLPEAVQHAPLTVGTPCIAVPLVCHNRHVRSLSLRSTRKAAARKSVASKGERIGCVMADGLARLLLEEDANPALLGLASWSELTVVICEGEMDYLSWASRLASDGNSIPVFGLVTGSWSGDIAGRIPEGCTVAIRTHQDTAGDAMAKTVGRSLHGRTLLRLATACRRDDNERLQAGDLPADPTRDCQPYEPVQWPDLLPISSAPSTLPPFPVDALGGDVSRYVQALAHEHSVPACIPGLAALSAIAAALAPATVVEPKPSWQEPTALWTLSVAPPGTGKSPVFSAMFRPARDYERQAAQDMAPMIARAEGELESLQREWKRSLRDHSTPELKEKSLDLAAQVKQYRVPRAPRLITADVTPEKLAMMLHDHGGSMALVTAEGAEVFSLMADRYGTKGTTNMEVFLKTWGGEAVTVDRKTGPSVHVERATLTMALSVQSGVLRRLGSRREFEDRGMTARFLYGIADFAPGYESASLADTLDKRLADAWAATITQLLRHTDRHKEQLPREQRVLHLTPDAKDAFESFMADRRLWVRPNGDLEHMPDWGGKKLHGQLLRVAAALHAVDTLPDPPWEHPIAVETVQRSRRILEWCAPHACAAYAMMRPGRRGTGVGEAILDWVRREHRPSFCETDLYRSIRKRAAISNDMAKLREGLRLLVDLGYLRPRDRIPTRRSGRPSGLVYDVNPSWLPSV